MNATCSPIATCVSHPSEPSEPLAATASRLTDVLEQDVRDFLLASDQNLGDIEVQLEQQSRELLRVATEKAAQKKAEVTPPVCPVCQQALSRLTGDHRRSFECRLGRDRLLELNSFRPAAAQRIISQIQEQDRQPNLEDYLLDVFDHFGIPIEELAPQTWHLNSQGLSTESFPALPAEGMIATCDRRRALSREDVGFLTWDHPMVTGAMDLLLGAETGNCAFAVLPAANERTILLELIFVLEAIAAPYLHVDRFLPPTPVHMVVNHKLVDLSNDFSDTLWERKLEKGLPYKLIDKAEIAQHPIPAMLQVATSFAETQAATLRQSALKEMNHLLNHEVERLQMLLLVNDHIRPQEIQMAQAQQQELMTVLQQSRLRLDALRLIWKGPPEALR